MRQRRHVLQVSTFPFLAVLLCTMGSLILLLLVIDRRARVVARAKAVRAAALLAAEDAQAQARRQAELDRRQQALHAQLQRQDQEVLTQVRSVSQQSAAAVESMRRERVQAQELQKERQAELDRLAQGQKEVQARQAEVSQTAAKTQEAQRDLARLNGDLTQLERTLADLKEARKRDEHKYSLVPYRGRRGDNRRPLYVECGEGGILFHPDRAALAGLQMTLGNIRTEVEQRIARKRAAAATAKEKNETPYLLLLVRSNGVTTYYKVLSALEGLKIDFGYEFVEADWVLDFPDKEDAAVQPWMTAEQTLGGRPSTSRTTPPKASAGLTAGNSPQIPGAPTVGSGEGANPHPGLARGGIPGSSATGVDGPGQVGGGSAPAGVGFGGPVIAQAGQGSPGSFSAPGLPGSPQQGGGGIGLGGLGGTVPQRMPSSDGQGGLAGHPASMDGLHQPEARAREELAGSSIRPSKLDGLAKPQAALGQPLSPSTIRPSKVDNPVGRMGQPSCGPDGLAIRPTLNQKSQDPTLGGSQAPAGGSDGRTAVSGGSGGGEHRSDEPASQGRPILPPVLPNRSPAPSVPPERPRVFGNRDWILSLDCTADGVKVYPGGRRIPATALDRTAPGGNPLLQTVQSLIDRRQAMVRPGEPPYRPVVRFLVHPDGLRTYYRAYPALETLQVSMIRENVRPEKKEDR